jgi:hypothetical protein
MNVLDVLAAPWTAVIRFLARKYIDQSFEAGAVAAKVCAEMKFQVEKTTAYMNGHTDGVRLTLETLQREVRERQCTEQDIENIKKGMFH